MTAARRRGPLPLALAGALLLPLAQAAAGEDYGFMPKGGKALLVELLGTPPDLAEFREIARAGHTEAEWRRLIGRRGKAFSERELATLAAYLAVHMPLPDGAVKDAAEGGDLASSLPPDGRELAWSQCQSCHSLFTSHLTQIRDVQGWRNMFLSPFHREMKMSPQEREEFARYSALNMPMKIEDVPQDLRF
jgi:mono/diheme cytochrome c family protein